MVKFAEEYPWSSASAHLSGKDPSGILDLEWWRQERPSNWEEMLKGEATQAEAILRTCTYAGKPFGEDCFVRELGNKFGRYWQRGRPRKDYQSNTSAEPVEETRADQILLF